MVKGSSASDDFQAMSLLTFFRAGGKTGRTSEKETVI
jgi:hypothetical protein